MVGRSRQRFAFTNVSAFVIKTGSTTQWQADLAPKEMAVSDMRNRHHVQLLLTWSTDSSCIPGSGALTGYYQPGQLSPGFFIVSLLLLPLLLFHPGLGPAKANAFVIKTGSTTQWQADLAPEEMATSEIRNRRHVQPLLTWSTNAAHPVSLDQEPLQGTISRAS
ncbi:hypothetical protein LAZ67_21001934 [Cordylochernes scorpioides]|uniref:Uncharacterized protein n=1 Tax=Cordylochernes scorpioides TaxID=51811 RepID=A0ABY6LSA6_9ARAC|nr:hypothetical protein LAZ67_21001934 [Cordylochernes scorpioides]